MSGLLPRDGNRIVAAGFESAITPGLVLAGQINEQTGRIQTEGPTSATNLIIDVYTANDTWTKRDNLSHVVVYAQGAGGAGGGCNDSQYFGVGGGAGGYAIKRLTTGELGATETVTIGAGGTGGNGNGPTGGNTSFGSHVTALGGSGGVGNTSNNNQSGGAGGAGSGGDYNITGQRGGQGMRTDGVQIYMSGVGGNSMFGFGGPSIIRDNGAIAGNAATGYGAGGGGAVNKEAGGSNANGGSGTGGLVIVYNYF